MAASTFGDFVGLTLHRYETDAATFLMAADDRLAGRPGFLHGGAIAAMLDIAAMNVLQRANIGRADFSPKLLGTSLEYLRGGKIVSTWVRVSILRQGSRIANVTGNAWQDDVSLPIATARLVFELRNR